MTATTTRRLAVVGIDGSGKSTIARKLVSLLPRRPDEVQQLLCPQYHNAPDVPLARLSRALDRLSTLGDELRDPNLKGLALYLQMTLYGPVERFLLATWSPRWLVSERHALVDSLVYASFYARIVTAPVERAVEGRVREALDAVAPPDGYEAFRAWAERRAAPRLGGAGLAWFELPPAIRALFAGPREALLPALERAYGTTLPDVVLLLETTGAVAGARVGDRTAAAAAAGGGGAGAVAELHERADVLDALARAYRETCAALARERPGLEVDAIDTTAAGVDEVLARILARIDAAAASGG